MSGREFWGSEKGRIILTVICCVVIWGITLALWMSESTAAVVVMLLCAFFGWRVLNMITPAVFIWMPLVGWLVYILIKFILSALIGLFVAPFKIGTGLAAKIQESIR